jgi:hypothetical protein
MTTTSPPRVPSKGARTEDERQRNRRVALPRNLAEATLADREQMLDQIFRVILEFSQQSGVSRERAARIFDQARRGVVKSPYRLSEALHFKVMSQVGDALTAWYTDPQYLDARGSPAPLPLSGATSVERLLRRYVPNVNARATARWLVAEGVVREQQQGLFLPLRRAVTFPQPNAMTLDRIPFLLQGLLSTVSHNTEAKPKGRDTRCEQMLALDRFPVSQVPRLNWEVKRLVPMLLDQLESWADPYVKAATAAPTSQKTARVGIEVFSYVEEHAPRAKRARAKSL